MKPCGHRHDRHVAGCPPCQTMSRERRQQTRANQGGHAPYWLPECRLPFHNDGPWREQAACKGLPVNMFYPERGEDSRDAKTVCDACPVLDDCLADAMRHHEHHGIWGGLSERERRYVNTGHLVRQPAKLKPGHLHLRALELWGRSLPDERADRLEPGASEDERWQLTRVLIAELRAPAVEAS